MPHVDIKYSDDLTLETEALFDCIEAVINQQDPGAGVCKSRAYPTSSYKHSHILIEVQLLKKPHRTAAFSSALLQHLEEAIKAQLAAMAAQSCYFSLSLDYCSDYYVTNRFSAAAPENMLEDMP